MTKKVTRAKRRRPNTREDIERFIEKHGSATPEELRRIVLKHGLPKGALAGVMKGSNVQKDEDDLYRLKVPITR